MTTVVAVRDIVKHRVILGSDAQATFGNMKLSYSPSKIIILGDYLIAASGSTRIFDIIEAHCNPPDPKPENVSLRMHLLKTWVNHLRDVMKQQGFKENENNAERFNGYFIVAHKDDFCVVNGNFSVSECPEGYFAIGSGEQFALGSLITTQALKIQSVKERVKLAVSAAIQADIYSSGNVTIKTT